MTRDNTTRWHLLLLLLLLVAIPASAGRREIFVTGKDHALWTKAFDGSAWGEWQRIDVPVHASPDAIAGPGFIEVFFLGPDAAIHHMRRTGSTWGARQSLGGELHGSPGAVRLSNGDIHVFARGSDFAMWHIAWRNGQWGAWESVGGEFGAARPQAIDHGNGNLEVFAVGKDQKIWAQTFDGRNWSGWDYINEGLLVSDPAVATLSGHTEVMALGTDRRVWRANRGASTGGAWSTWAPWDEERFDAGHNPDLAADGSEPVLAIRGMDGAVRVRTSAGWTNVGGEIASDPAVVVEHSGQSRTFIPPTPAPAPSAVYRLTINGFIVNRETNDDPLERDGARDEVFIKAYAAVAGSPQSAPIPAMTRVFGDVHNHPARIRAGSARGVPDIGADGGFMTGDAFPTRTPWARAAEPVRPQEAADGEVDLARLGVSRLPMVAWEGRLVRGANAVVVVPAIIETDNQAEHSSRDTTYLASALAGGHSAQLLAATPATVDQLIRELGQAVARSVRYPQGPDPGDRPIGMQLEGGQYVWKTSPIVLTYDIAEAMVGRPGEYTDVRRGPDGSSRSITQPLPPGVSWINWRDHPDLGGDYTLFWQLEKVR